MQCIASSERDFPATTPTWNWQHELATTVSERPITKWFMSVSERAAITKRERSRHLCSPHEFDGKGGTREPNNERWATIGRKDSQSPEPN